ncbi:hypothetical protein, partial [Mesorhizobium sp. M7A.F.Ca.MR.362.00.0.0]|uniref:hypothetical protein n=1 Tax=Mesorhizobium sp. M7A.F.Ca.MR.362.00.0.0 TaxID=2496779 RepID=UPI0019D45254
IIESVMADIEGLDFADDDKRQDAEDSIICTVQTLIDRLATADAERASTQADILRLKAALAPFSAMAAASDKLAVEGQRRLQPKESAELTDAEIASLVVPDNQVVMTDGRMAFGHDQHPSKPVRVTMGDLRRAARSLSQEGEEGA